MLSLEQYKKEKKTIDIYEASKLAVVLFFVPLTVIKPESYEPSYRLYLIFN